MKIAAIQLATLPMSKAKLDYYFRICKKKEAELVVLAEYVLNSFFKELEKMPVSMIKEQTDHKITVLKELCKEYGLVVVAPIVLVKKDKIIKANAKITSKSAHFFEQQFLINYKHWNEERFFDNEFDTSASVATFTLNGLKFGILSGFELHFDHLWIEMLKRKVDAVLIPSASTFNSSKRWNELLKSRAFLNGMYVLRVNRIGEYKDKKSIWKFYGETSIINPYGDIENILGSKEELLIANIDKNESKEAKKAWGFRAQLAKRGWV